MSSTTAPATDFGAITQRQQATWATGDFHEISRQIVTVSEDLILAVDPAAGKRVLDVACGSGNTALVAARRYCEVTGIDYVPALVQRAKVRAEAEGVRVDLRVADAQALPFPDATFDVVVSVFGVMFAPDQEKAASELLRVCRPGGRIGLATWMPQDWGGAFFKMMSKYVPPPPGIQPPSRWGTEAGVQALLGPGSRSITTEKRSFYQYFRSLPEAVDIFRRYFGPANKAFASLDAAGQAALQREVEALYQEYNRAKDGTLKLEATYMQVVAERK